MNIDYLLLSRVNECQPIFKATATEYATSVWLHTEKTYIYVYQVSILKLHQLRNNIMYHAHSELGIVSIFFWNSRGRVINTTLQVRPTPDERRHYDLILRWLCAWQDWPNTLYEIRWISKSSEMSEKSSAKAVTAELGGCLNWVTGEALWFTVGRKTVVTLKSS